MIIRWWMAPVFGISACAIANGALIVAVMHVRPQKSEDRPYTASAHEDERAAEREAFASRGWHVAHMVEAAGCTLTLTCVGGAQPVGGVVNLFRPDDVAADRELVWTDLAKPLHIALPRPGAWSVRVALRDGTGTVLAHAVRLDRP